jgi:hypothetical protein
MPSDRIGRLARDLQHSYVRRHARGAARRGRWAVLVRSAVGLLIVLLLVVGIAQTPSAECAASVQLDLEAGDEQEIAAVAVSLIVVLIWWLAVIAAAIVAVRRVVRTGQRRSLWMYANWHRRIQGAVASMVGKVLLVTVLVAVLGLASSGRCDGPDWFGVALSGAMFFGVVLAVLGSAVATEAGWVGFALVVVVDLLSAALLLGYAVLDPDSGRFALVGAVAFTIHATCTAVATRWSFVVATTPGARVDDRAKAGETGRSLCALWVLLLIASLVVILDDSLLDSALSFLTSPVIVALTLGALAVTLGGGHTKFVEGREAARRRARDRRASTTATFDRREELIPRIAARMIAACGPLPTRQLAAGINRVAAFRLGDRQLRRELGGDLVVRDRVDSSSDTWGLRPDTDPAAFGWPTDRVLLDLVARAGRRDFTRSELADLLDRAGYRGLDDGDYAVDTHPLIRPHGRFRRGRWSVLDVTAAGRPDGGGPPRGLVH